MTWHLHIKGRVQGVGFRPFVYRLAREWGLCGAVWNAGDGVHVVFNANAEQAGAFGRAIYAEAPPLAVIQRWEHKPVADQPFSDFKIVQSSIGTDRDTLLSPDFGICDDCRAELQETNNRRAQYAFTTCTNCGPRYSIATDLPYDRPQTTMAEFSMCPDCHTEYTDPSDRRYHSQTNSCPNCAIQLALYQGATPYQATTQTELLDRVVTAWKAGAIVAIKGIGGYLLTCRADCAATVEQLRNRKQRPDKPLALMYPDTVLVRAHFSPSDKVIDLLEGPTAPIVLLPRLSKQPSGLALDSIAPRLAELGVMLPYTPLYQLLLQRYGQPVVATSANFSGSPILYREPGAQETLHHLADWILTNNRAIAVPQDDSVLRIAPDSGRTIVLRRSRGLAPNLLTNTALLPEPSVWSMGASLKSTFAITHRGQLYLSQYLGDLDHFGTQESYRHCLKHLHRMLGTQPACILTDLHPAYPSTHLGADWARQLRVPTQAIQHHEAHFAAILGEANLVDLSAPILGFIWDGTGLGSDGQIWGGECFRYEAHHFERVAHLPYFPQLAADKMAREPRLSALVIGHSVPILIDRLRAKFTDSEWRIYQQLLTRNRGLKTSSMGRLFDGVASLLNLADRQSYEGAAAMRLEQLARSYRKRYPEQQLSPYKLSPTPGWLSALVEAIGQDIEQEVPTDKIALRFHLSLVDWVRQLANKQRVKYLAFSGGVFQNALLVDLLSEQLSEQYQLHFHQQLSPNDENIAFGQLIHYGIQQRQRFDSQLDKQAAYVLSNTR